MVKGVIQAMAYSSGKLTLAAALERVNKVNWSASSANYWRDIIVRPDGRMGSGSV
jgi:hypothetical protein